MKLFLASAFALSLFEIKAQAQSASVTATTQLQLDNQPLVIMNNERTTTEYFNRYKNLMADVREIEGTEAVKLYGADAKNGVIIANSINTVRFLSFQKIINSVTLTNEQRKLPVAVDGVIKSNPKLIMLKADDFHHVEVDGKMLNIITRR